MHHPAELAIHQYMENATQGKSTMSESTIKQVGLDVMTALQKQFGKGTGRGDFRLRMSNVGRPTCQLWYEKNKPEVGVPLPTTFVMNMMLGDIVEAVFKGIMKEAGVKYEDTDKVTLEVGGHSINGSYDIVVDDAVDDIKSASDWSYRNKFKDFATLKAHDSFGYVGQLAGYAKASGLKPGGWWVVNKANGSFKYVPAKGIDMMEEMYHINKTVKTVNKNEFKRCFDSVEETFNGKPTGNKVLGSECSWCSFRKTCWPKLKELPALKSRAKEPKIVSYVHIEKESKA